MAPEIREMSAQEYFASPGLSYSGMKDLAVSPYRYWFRRLNPEAPLEEESDEQVFGKALHKLILEPAQFESAYAREVVLEEIPGCLRTINEMRDWIRDKGHAPKGNLKSEVIAKVQSIDPNWPILDVLKAQHEEANRGKVIMKSADFSRVHACAASLMDEPIVVDLLKDAAIEQALFVKDAETGVLLKGRLDAMLPTRTLDFKTYTQRRGKTIDQSVLDAIWYEGYHHQAFMYALLRGWPEWKGSHTMIFVESDPPHEVRIRQISPTVGGQMSLLFDRARFEVRALIQQYADCLKYFGTEKPWRSAQQVDVVVDEEIKALAFS
jgi:hypothetical protein